MYDIIVIGAGPSGMTAALYAKRANKKVLVLEALTPGGQIINANKIDNYPGLPGISGTDFAMSLYNQVIELDAEVKKFEEEAAERERAIKLEMEKDPSKEEQLKEEQDKNKQILDQMRNQIVYLDANQKHIVNGVNAIN